MHEIYAAAVSGSEIWRRPWCVHAQFTAKLMWKLQNNSSLPLAAVFHTNEVDCLLHKVVCHCFSLSLAKPEKNEIRYHHLAHSRPLNLAAVIQAT